MNHFRFYQATMPHPRRSCPRGPLQFSPRCQRWKQLVALGKAAGVQTRLVRVAQGKVAHLWPVRLDGDKGYRLAPRLS
jgi:hypothetical protein